MDGILLVGVLSGMVFGTLAMIVRRFTLAIVLAPVLLAPFGSLFVWRDALLGQCFFASHFNSDMCMPFRALIAATLNHTGDAILVLIAHVVVGITMVAVLNLIRRTIAKADMSVAKPAKDGEAEGDAHEVPA